MQKEIFYQELFSGIKIDDSIVHGGNMKKQTGFTLLELMATIAIIAILSAVAVPNFMSWRTSKNLGAGAREILSAIQETRMIAIKNQIQTVITFDTDTGSYEAFIDDGMGSNDDDLDGILDKAKNGTREGDEAIIVSGRIPGDIRIINASFGGIGAQNRFDSRGMASANGNVTLANQSGESRKIIVLMSGSARIE
jgi:type IV fimbrial biogenesis protein FimT